MADTTPGDPGEVRTARATEGEGSRISRSGGKSNTTSTVLDIERLEALSKEEALALAYERLSATLVLYQNLGGEVAMVTLPEGKQILGRRDLIILPAVRDKNSGTFALYVPELYQNGVPE